MNRAIEAHCRPPAAVQIAAFVRPSVRPSATKVDYRHTGRQWHSLRLFYNVVLTTVLSVDKASSLELDHCVTKHMTY